MPGPIRRRDLLVVWRFIKEDNYAVTYELNAFTSEPKLFGATYSDLRKHIPDAFNEAGIEIMTPSVPALRDANQPAIPPDYNPPGFPGFRLFKGE